MTTTASSRSPSIAGDFHIQVLCCISIQHAWHKQINLIDSRRDYRDSQYRTAVLAPNNCRYLFFASPARSLLNRNR